MGGAGELIESAGVSDTPELEGVPNSFVVNLNSATTSERGAFIALMRDPEAGFTAQESSRKRMFTESRDGGRDNGDSDQHTKYRRDVKSRVKGYTEHSAVA